MGSSAIRYLQSIAVLLKWITDGICIEANKGSTDSCNILPYGKKHHVLQLIRQPLLLKIAYQKKFKQCSAIKQLLFHNWFIIMSIKFVSVFKYNFYSQTFLISQSMICWKHATVSWIYQKSNRACRYQKVSRYLMGATNYVM